MDIKQLLSKVDHTLLSVDAQSDGIRKLLNEGIKYKTASCCIPPCFVKEAKEYVKNDLKICTVIGFPNGYCTRETKLFEAQNALLNGADELDMVINVAMLKSKNFDYVLDEITSIKKLCGEKTLKVIVEACLLSKKEKNEICELIEFSGANFIKTSTGFSKSGANESDVELFKKLLSDRVLIKAAGGIHTIEEAEAMLAAGADRIGASSLVKCAVDRNLIF